MITLKGIISRNLQKQNKIAFFFLSKTSKISRWKRILLCEEKMLVNIIKIIYYF